MSLAGFLFLLGIALLGSTFYCKEKFNLETDKAADVLIVLLIILANISLGAAIIVGGWLA